MRQDARATFIAAFAGLAVTVPLAVPSAQTVFQPRSLNQFLAANNWVALPIPDNKTRPGTVIKVTKQGNNVDVRWLGDFRSCGVTDQALGFVRGKYPAFGIGEKFAVGASFAASLLSWLGGTAQIEKINGAILDIQDAGGDAIDLLALSIWLTKPSNVQKLPATCTAFLAQEGVYLVSEAFRVTKGSYELVDKNGAKIEVAAAAAGRSGTGAINGSISSTGTLTVSDDLYFGVRRVKQLAPDSFSTLGTNPAAVSEADDLLREAAQ
jgi:hypothetical protein